MGATASLKVIKSFSYRGETKLWSNRYHFDGTTPPDSTHWTTLSDAVTAAEKAALSNVVTIVGTVGFNPGSDVPVFNKTYSLTGLVTTGSVWLSPGDAAMLVRYSTASRTRKNHPLYLYSWYHGVFTASAGAPDTVSTSLTTPMGTYASSWITGFSDGTATHHRAGPNGDLATGVLVETTMRHRDFPNG